LQLACGMIAAAQVRASINEALPFDMFGILVVADQFAFARVKITRAYLDCLLTKATPPRLEFHWWPKEFRSQYPDENVQTMYGIQYGDVNNREVIVKTLCLLQRKFSIEATI
jgi:hypothetical protein